MTMERISPPPEETTGKEARPWSRLHRSTWIIVFLSAILFIAISYPGVVFSNNTSYESGSALGYTVCNPWISAHGWPWPFLKRTQFFTTDRSIPWTYLSAWSLRGTWESFSFFNLTLDILVMLVVLAAVGFYFERRRRKGIRLLQCTIKELMILTFFVALGLSYWAYHHQRRNREHVLLQTTPVKRIERWICPSIFVRIFGYDLLNDFKAVVVLQISEDVKLTSQEYVNLFHAMPYLEELSLYPTTSVNNEVLEALRHCSQLEKVSAENFSWMDALCEILDSLPHLKSVYLSNQPISSQGMKALGRNKTIEELHLYTMKVQKNGLQNLAAMKTVESLSLNAIDLDDKDIEWLGTMKQLRQLDISGNKMTREGIEKLQKMLPDCSIKSDFPDIMDGSDIESSIR